MASLVETIVVDLGWLIEKHLFAGSLDRSHHLLVSRSQVIHVQLLLLDKEERRTDSDRGMSLLFELKHCHTLVIPCREIVQSRVRSHNPVPIGVLPHSVD